MLDTITVSTREQLYAALRTATGGETIQLEGGNYGNFSLNRNMGFNTTFPSNVTLVSADPKEPAIFSAMDVRNSANLTFDGILFDYTFAAGQPDYYQPFKISDSSNITIVNSTFDGDLATGVSAIADGFAYATGLAVRGSQNVTIANNESFEFFRGMKFLQTTGLEVSGNNLHSMRMDGLNFAAVSDVLIESNYIHDFRGTTSPNDHRDFIQFWTAGTNKPNTDIVIKGNVLDIGAGTFTQSIFMANEAVSRGLAGSEMYYRNVEITDNVIVNGQLHGITLGDAAGVLIANNTLLHADGDAPDGADGTVEIPRINVAGVSTDVTITGNTTSDITGYKSQSDWSVSQNTFVQDQNPGAPGYYGLNFLTKILEAAIFDDAPIPVVPDPDVFDDAPTPVVPDPDVTHDAPTPVVPDPDVTHGAPTPGLGHQSPSVRWALSREATTEVDSGKTFPDLHLASTVAHFPADLDF